MNVKMIIAVMSLLMSLIIVGFIVNLWVGSVDEEFTLAEKIAVEKIAENGIIVESGMSALETLERENKREHERNMMRDGDRLDSNTEHWEDPEGRFDGIYLNTDTRNEYTRSVFEFSKFVDTLDDKELDVLIHEVRMNLGYRYDDFNECSDNLDIRMRDELIEICPDLDKECVEEIESSREGIIEFADTVRDSSNFCLMVFDEGWNSLDLEYSCVKTNPTYYTTYTGTCIIKNTDWLEHVCSKDGFETVCKFNERE